MPKYIDVDALNWYDDLFMKGENHSGVWVRYRDVEHFIKDATPADVRPVVRGHWIRLRGCYSKCSVCGNEDAYAYKLKIDTDETYYEQQDMFCPFCGADMREQEDKE